MKIRPRPTSRHPGLAALCHAGIRRADGASAIEFALVAPIFLLILVAMIDFGMVLYTRFNLSQGLSASANYAMVSAANASSSNGAALAASLSAIIPARFDATVVVNNGPQSQRTSGTTVASGTVSNADLCYCPVLSGTSLAWGSATTCASSCSGGGLAGKFVSITGSIAVTPFFGSYGLVQNGTISVSTVVQVQ
ncbi:TadE/TadG family type IV pilus assembly protein [Labrys wisconsinensis]|uniref:TadE-like domain-containing protein n=1 Tax=Labrys wisconsinensis TaxID=425677 RepID=A0ABU0J1A5_9HYPH|nr:TadE/TadG family type IV pilus assembly protein [Labrys wisconsinensis]MDQ0468036.1 hypothetical protein [Labrys wisconsinensis]